MLLPDDFKEFLKLLNENHVDYENHIDYLLIGERSAKRPDRHSRISNSTTAEQIRSPRLSYY